MLSMAAAFLGERLPKVADAQGRQWPCIADNYVLCNPPYSVVEDNMAENWTSSNLRAADGSTGRQTAAARLLFALFYRLLRLVRSVMRFILTFPCAEPRRVSPALFNLALFGAFTPFPAPSSTGC